jgi:hypothetical protein
VFFVTCGNDETANNKARDTAVDALALAEQLESEKRPNLKIMDRSTGAPITLEELRGRATAGAGSTAWRRYRLKAPGFAERSVHVS